MAKQILYIDLDNTLVDFSAKLDGIDPAVLTQYEGRYDELPGVFALMPPVAGALKAYRELAETFDVYILSTAPWLNPSAWQHKLEWAQLHLGIVKGTPAYKRLILTHHKHLNRGDFLVDDRPWHNGADRFEGAVIHFGDEHDLPSGRTVWPTNVVAHLSTWPDVVAHLMKEPASGD